MPTLIPSRISAWLVIEDEFRFEITKFQSSFAVNTLPTATVSVGIGRDLRRDEPAKIHEVYSQLPPDAKAQAWFIAEDGDPDLAPSGLPQQVTLLFDGLLTRRGFVRSGTAGEVTLSLRHWLSALNESSAISASSHPGNPADLVYPAVFRPLGAGQNSGKVMSWTPVTSTSRVNAGGLSDLWGNILYHFLEDIAQDIVFDLALGEPPNAEGIAASLAALRRMGPNPDGVPAELDQDGIDAEVVSRAMREALTREVGNPWVNTTLWGKLVGEWSPAFWLAVIPRISDALVVPLAGGLRGDPWRSLLHTEETHVQIDGVTSQQLRAVAISHPIVSGTNVFLDGAPGVVSLSGAAGLYRPAADSRGIVLIKQAPAWLQAQMAPVAPASQTAGLDGQVGNQLGDIPDNQQPARRPQHSPRRILDRYAEQWFVNESLKDHTGQVSGRLRFDICPGSSLRIETGRSPTLTPAEDQTQEDHYGTVVQVSYVIDARAQQAGTVFDLAHVRTASENEQPGKATDRPALYKTIWRGAGMHPST